MDFVRFIDGLTTSNAFFAEKYDDVKRLDIMKRSRFEDRVPRSQSMITSILTNGLLSNKEA